MGVRKNMRDIQFIKMQGAGNDFVIVDLLKNDDHALASEELKKLAAKICDRHFGIGADGLILVLPSKKADYRMRIFNPDSSEPEMCGNGIRCFSRYIFEQIDQKKEVFSVETVAGIMVPTLVTQSGIVTGVEVDMGVPVVETLNEGLTIEGDKMAINKISMGNPHCVIFVDDIETVDFTRLGPIIENLPLFPNKTNVEFAQVINEREISVKVWERGAGYTLACGTGACATAVAAISNGLAGSPVMIHLPGGDINIEWSGQKESVIMTGPAETVFKGTIKY
jgi:diaminopimelate epimerase